MFNKEHVIHKAASAGFRNNLTVKICKDCNDLFATTIDKEIGDDSFEAYKRAALGGKNADSLVRGDRSKRLSVSVYDSESEPRVMPVKSTNDAKDPVVAETRARLTRRGSEELVELGEQDLKKLSKEDFLNDFDLSKGVQMTGRAEDLMAIQTALQETMGSKMTAVSSKAVKASVQILVDEDIQRSAAKVAFNYLLSRCRTENVEFPFSNDFNALRDFVMRGVEPPHGRLVNPLEFPRDKNHTLLSKNGYFAMIEYGINADTDKPCLIAKIKLSEDYCYMVTLAKEITGERCHVEGAHFWDLSDKTITFLNADEIRELRGM
ncbi:MAG TPA: hypothetical protein V6C97_12880 [Oculatellaceae cyanobacterium]